VFSERKFVVVRVSFVVYCCLFVVCLLFVVVCCVALLDLLLIGDASVMGAEPFNSVEWTSTTSINPMRLEAFSSSWRTQLDKNKTRKQQTTRK